MDSESGGMMMNYIAKRGFMEARLHKIRHGRYMSEADISQMAFHEACVYRGYERRDERLCGDYQARIDPKRRDQRFSRRV